MDNFWSQKQAFCSFGRSFRIGVSSYRVHPIVWERVLAGGEFLAASRYVFGVEDAGGGGWYGLLEKAAVQHLHGSIDGWSKHIVDFGHWGRLKAYFLEFPFSLPFSFMTRLTGGEMGESGGEGSDFSEQAGTSGEEKR